MIGALLAFPVAGAFISRVRGGLLPTGHTQIARAIYAVAFSAMTFVATGRWLFAALCLPAWFAGAMASNHWGAVRNRVEVEDGSLSGLLNTAAPAVLLVALWHPMASLLLLAGAAKGPIYWLAVHKIPSRIPHLRGGEIGEALYGATVGLALAIAGVSA